MFFCNLFRWKGGRLPFAAPWAHTQLNASGRNIYIYIYINNLDILSIFFFSPLILSLKKRERDIIMNRFSLCCCCCCWMDGWKNTRKRQSGWVYSPPPHFTWLVVFRWRMRDRRRRDKLWKKKESLGRGCNHLSRRRRRRKTGSTWLLSSPYRSGLIISLSLTFSLLLLIIISLFFSLPSLHFLSLVLSIFSRRFLYLFLILRFYLFEMFEIIVKREWKLNQGDDVPPSTKEKNKKNSFIKRRWSNWFFQTKSTLTSYI